MSRVQQVSSNALIVNDQKEVLLVDRAVTDDFLPGYWELPGGGIEYGETPQEGLIREIHEECGIAIEINKPISVNTYFIKDLHRVEITFLCHPLATEVTLSAEHSAYQWIKLQDMTTLKISDYIKNILTVASHTIS